MKKWLIAVLVSLPLSAMANGFAGIDFVSSKVEPKFSDRDASPKAAQFKLGTWINREQTLGGEARIGLGLNDSSLGPGANLEINRMYGAYLRGQFPNTVVVRPYALIGFSRIETTTKFRDAKNRSENLHDLSLGIGADVDITPVVFASVEYMRAVDRSSRKVSNLSFGINGRF